MIFPIPRLRLNAPLPYSHGPSTCLRPVVPLAIVGPSAQVIVRCWLDSGADSVVVPELHAQHLGIPLLQLPGGSTTAVGGARILVRYAQVLLELDHGRIRCRWRAHVGFAPMNTAVLGIIGGLEHFLTSLDFLRRELTMLPQSTLPATNDVVP